LKRKFIVQNESIRDRALAAVRELPLGMEVAIKPHKSSRSLQQNNLYWKWLDIIRMHIADSTGKIFSAEELAEWFKAKFLPARIVEIDGEAIPCRRTTTKLNTAEMAAYLDAIDRYCIDSLGLYLPQPGQEAA
jgi:hypothetical protein